MGSFAQKQNQPQRQTSSNLRLLGTSTSLPGHVIHPAMHLQRTPGNQAVLCLRVRMLTTSRCIPVLPEQLASPRF